MVCISFTYEREVQARGSCRPVALYATLDMIGVTDGLACAVAVESGSLVDPGGSVDSPCFSSNCTPTSKSRRLLVDVACIVLLLLGIFALVALSLSYNPPTVRVIGSVVEVAVYWACDEASLDGTVWRRVTWITIAGILPLTVALGYHAAAAAVRVCLINVVMFRGQRPDLVNVWYGASAVALAYYNSNGTVLGQLVQLAVFCAGLGSFCVRVHSIGRSSIVFMAGWFFSEMQWYLVWLVVAFPMTDDTYVAALVCPVRSAAHRLKSLPRRSEDLAR